MTAAWYNPGMTTKVEQAFSALSNLPVERQEEIADAILSAAMPTVEWPDEVEVAVDEGLADLAAGRVVDADIAFAAARDAIAKISGGV